MRVSRLADDHPTIAEIDLNPVIAGFEHLSIVDAKIRIQPDLTSTDPGVPRLHPPIDRTLVASAAAGYGGDNDLSAAKSVE